MNELVISLWKLVLVTIGLALIIIPTINAIKTLLANK